MPTVFITGCSTGLGKACAILFAKSGWDVIATMRRPEAADAELVNDPKITLMRLDVTSLENIEEVVQETLNRTVVDVVINNAGYAQVGPVEGTSDEAIQAQLDTNILGVIRVTKAFIGHFRERRSGVFITITSIGGHVTFPFNSLYHATKWALEGFSESLQFELGGFGIRVKNVAPGGIITAFTSRVAESIAKHEAYEEIMDKTLNAFRDPARRANYSTAEQIAEVVYEAATDQKDQVHYLAGADAKALYESRIQAGPEVFRQNIETRFLGTNK